MKKASNRLLAVRFAQIALATSCVLMSSCAPSLVEAPEELPPFSEALMQCTRWLDGSFIHERPDGDADAQMMMKLNQTRIWSGKTDGIWLYSELLLMESGGERMMHQLVYRVQDDPSGGILIDSYELPGDSSRFKGAWSDPELFDRLDSFMLKAEPGCAMRLHRMAGGGFKGGTLGENCRTTRGGAARLSESLTVGSLEILYGLEGYEETGRRVFGSKEPLVFTRRNPTEEPRFIKPGTDQPTDLKMYNLDPPSE